ncbi:FMN-dependent NADH-azoreductase [Paraburkholderia sp. BL25I1N1]|uniref:FMN-dependent NADH-azoreductase n=1 Tax=Paraburkholderia sp. BL25I1N1 TaxID=1938804 RepID=UPI000D4F962A|nr:NAD(P)H-dependent oxidoreductase [Paraburkholderia sp. BL25I1N1]PRY04505.1 FMN-dependent NADH-azoreductase [Paraburkholderia sp. BL25I1N1]
MSAPSRLVVTGAAGRPGRNAVRLLHIDTSIKATGWLSRELSAAAVERLKREAPDIVVHYRDLAAHPLGDLTGRIFAAHAQGADIRDLDQAELSDLAESGKVLDEFLTSEVIVMGVAFYNFTVPSSLKAWIDRICVAGKTFSYGASGVVGLARGKRVIVLLARGGFYGEGSPNARHEHAETYLRSVFSVLGIDNLEVIVAEGVDVSPELRATALETAMGSIETLAA